MPRQFGVPENIIQEVVAGRQPPSTYSPYLSKLHDKHVIGINNAYMLGTWIDVEFFGDYNWYLIHRAALASWPNLKVSCAVRIGSSSYEGVKYIERDNKHTSGISTNVSAVSWNNNSGTAAISLAHHFGVKRVLLLGFDMTVGNGNASHWHGPHRQEPNKDIKHRLSSFNRHLKGFPMVARDASLLKMEILNVSQTSVVQEFRKVTLDEVLT